MTNQQNITPAELGKVFYNELLWGDWVYCSSDNGESILKGECDLLLEYLSDINAGKMSVELATQQYASDFMDAHNP